MAVVKIIDPNTLLPKAPKGIVHLTCIDGRNVPVPISRDQKMRCFDAVCKQYGRMIDVLKGLLPERGTNTILRKFGRGVIARSDTRAVSKKTDHVDLPRNVHGPFQSTC